MSAAFPFANLPDFPSDFLTLLTIETWGLRRPARPPARRRPSVPRAPRTAQAGAAHRRMLTPVQRLGPEAPALLRPPWPRPAQGGPPRCERSSAPPRARRCARSLARSSRLPLLLPGQLPTTAICCSLQTNTLLWPRRMWRRTPQHSCTRRLRT